MHPQDSLPPWKTSNCNTCRALASKISTHQKLPDSKRLAFAGLRAPSLTSRSTRQIDPSVDVSREKIVNLTEKAERLSNELFSSAVSGA